MKVKEITLDRFRQFEHTTVHFGDFNVIVGPNNSGKTTILHAIRAFFSLMKGHVRFEGKPLKPSYHRRFLSSVEELVPTPDPRELWFGKRAGKPCKITVTFDDDAAFSVVLRQQFGQVHVSAEDLPNLSSAAQMKGYLDLNVAFIPGLVGVLVDEPYATLARRNSLASQGRYSEIFRSSMHQLQERDGGLTTKVNDVLQDLFGLTITAISFNPDKEEYVTVRYKQRGTEFDVVSSGAGLQQVIQILTYLYLASPKILLIDEPDAHLHSQLQARMGALFRRVADDLGAQVFLSTHSLDLIDTADPREVIVLDSERRDVHPLGENADLVSALVSAGIVENSSLSRILASKRMVIIEDQNTSLYKVIDRVTGAGLCGASSAAYVKSAQGASNFPQYKELAAMLESFSERSIDLVFVQDRDGMPDFMVADFEASMKRQGMRVHLLERHEIENYLVTPQLISDTADGQINVDAAVAAIVSAGESLKSRARQMCRKTARDVNRHFPSSKKKKNDLLDQEVDSWFDDLDGEDWQTVTRIWPGRELLKEVRKQISKEHNIELRQGALQAALNVEHLPDELVSFWKELGQVSPPRRRRRVKKAKKAKRL